MNRFSKKIFDGVVHGVMYTPIDDVEDLAHGRQLSIIATCDTVVEDPGSGSHLPAHLTVAIQHSSDGRVFAQKNANPEINYQVLNSTGTTTLTGGEATATPSMKYVRLAISIANNVSPTGYTIKAHVVVHVAVRGSRKRTAEEDRPKPLVSPSAHANAVRTADMISEITTLADEAKHLQPMERAAHVLTHLSVDAKNHIRALDSQLLTMPPHARRAMAQATAGLMQLALDLGGGRLHAKGGCCSDGLGRPKA